MKHELWIDAIKNFIGPVNNLINVPSNENLTSAIKQIVDTATETTTSLGNRIGATNVNQTVSYNGSTSGTYDSLLGSGTTLSAATAQQQLWINALKNFVGASSDMTSFAANTTLSRAIKDVNDAFSNSAKKCIASSSLTLDTERQIYIRTSTNEFISAPGGAAANTLVLPLALVDKSLIS